MDATQLRALKTPLTKKFPSTSGAALIKLQAKSSVDDDAITCNSPPS